MKEPKYLQRDQTMTQLIAVLCDDKKRIILISDRMVSTSDESLAFEHESKCAFLSTNAMILTAGTIHEPEIIEDTKCDIKGRMPIRKIAENLTRNYRKIRRQRIEQTILERVGICSYDEFHEKQKILHDVVVQDISDDIKKYTLGVYFILAGVDQDGRGHLYRIANPGTYDSFDELGFCCIGNGDRHAEPVFAFYGFSPKLSLEKALSIGFEAKKRSEMAGGVGKETDIWIIEKNAIYKTSDGTVKELEATHAKQEDYSKLLKPVKIQKQKIGISETQD
jgi:hypothetical protein